MYDKGCCDSLSIQLLRLFDHIDSDVQSAVGLQGLVDEALETNGFREIRTDKTGSPTRGFDFFDCRPSPRWRVVRP